MASVTLTIVGRPYTVGCEDGQEDHLRHLAHELDRRARAMADATGAVGEGLILVLAGLMLADEVADAKAVGSPLQDENAALKARVAELEAQMGDSRAALQQAHQRLEQRRDENAGRAQQDEEVARAIETLASRIETVAERLAAS